MKKNALFLLFAIAALTSFKPETDEWQEFKPDNGKCSVLMPGKAEKKDKIVNTAIGEVTMHMYLYQPKEGDGDANVFYAVTYGDFPGNMIHSDSTALIKTFFDNSRDGSVKNVQGKLLTESIIDINGYPGREIRVDFKNGMAIIKMRSYLVKNRFYMLQVITLTENNFNKSINKFMDSFKLL